MPDNRFTPVAEPELDCEDLISELITLRSKFVRLMQIGRTWTDSTNPTRTVRIGWSEANTIARIV